MNSINKNVIMETLPQTDSTLEKSTLKEKVLEKLDNDLIQKMQLANYIITSYAKIRNWDYGQFHGVDNNSKWNSELIGKWELSYSLTYKSKLKYKLFNSFEELFSELVKITYYKSKKNYMKMIKEIPSIIHFYMGLLDESNVRGKQLLKGLPGMNYAVEPKELIF